MTALTASTDRRTAIFCISSYEKGQNFLREAARLGCEVTLLTAEKLRDGDWPRECLAEFLTMPEDLTPKQVLNTVAYLARTRRIDRLVALDEFDLEAAALIREHMRLPGLGESQTRFFRDKLAMRTQAKSSGIAVPEFTGVFNYDDLRVFMNSVPGPWLLKPRTNASAIGIKGIDKPEELWPILDRLGDLQSHYLLERFVPGEVFHVEGVTWGGEVLFAQPCQYGKPPMQTMHQGGVFTTRTLPKDQGDGKALVSLHHDLLKALHLRSGVSHSEFIKASADGKFYFLETAARVGGAFIADVIAFASGLNPWTEWARIEVAAARGTEYQLPPLHEGFAGSVISLARQETPDLSGYQDPEIAERLHKAHHAGILLKSPDESRLRSLVEGYAERFLNDFCAAMPVPEKATA
jgi:biotin carboxylase